MKTFEQFVMEQAPEEWLEENNAGYYFPAVGAYYQHIGIEPPELVSYRGLTILDKLAEGSQEPAPELADVPPHILEAIDWSRAHTYGDLQQLFRERMVDAVCPSCRHGKGFNCRTCWPAI